MKFLPYGRARALLLAPALVAATIVGVVTHGSDLAGAAAAGGAWPIETHGAPRATDNVVLKWDEQLLSTIRAYPAQTGPTVTARALAVLHTATYDAWAAYDPTAVGTRPDGPAQQPGGTAADRSKAISVAAYRVLVDLFPPANFPSTATYSTPDVLMRSLQYDPADGSAPAAVGNQAAAAVLDFRHADGSNQLNGYADTTGYQSKNTWDEATDPWSWQPLCVLTAAGVSAKAPPFPADGACAAPNYAVQKPLTPQWENVTPFGPMDDRHFPPQFTLPGPPENADGTPSTADIDLALADTANLTDTEKAKAEYWADGPKSEFPPGHLAAFAQALSRMRGNTLDQDAKLFFVLGNALLDSSISAWAAKFEYDTARPATGIRERYRGKPVTSWLGPGKGFGTVPGEQWQPYQAQNVVTPAFPEYVSGHSTFSAAGRTVLNAFFGTDSFNAKVTIKAGSSRIEPNTPAKDVVLSWKTLTAAADEAGWSRRYGGIHYKTGDEHGRTLGKVVGYNAWITAQDYFAGTATP